VATVALTGTPGTGKSTVARGLPSRWKVIEVGELARRVGAARPKGASVEIDMRRLARGFRAGLAGRVDVVVGHLAHLLPVRDVVVLRCHPRELRRRLERCHRGTSSSRDENVVAEATDWVLIEALALRRRVWEVDTSGRSPAAVAREVTARIRRRGRPSYGRVDWLADPTVTGHLLEWER
jgi:adenylate kinase